jgi:hypothetical protein
MSVQLQNPELKRALELFKRSNTEEQFLLFLGVLSCLDAIPCDPDATPQSRVAWLVLAKYLRGGR